MKKIYLFLSIVLLSTYTGQAEDVDKSHLPKLLGSSNSGTEYFMTFHSSHATTVDEKLIKIYVSSSVETEVKLEIPGKDYLKTKKTIVNDVIEFELTPELALPYIKKSNEHPLPEQVFEGVAIHITSDNPIIVYGVIQYPGSSEGYLALPVSALGKEYIVASWPDPFGGSQGANYSSFTSIVAPYDKTTASVKFGGEDWTLTAGGKVPGDVSDFYMNSADVVCIGTVSKHGDLSGSEITGTKLISVVSGNQCAFVPTGVWSCEVLIEQELPTFAWGTEYHVMPIQGRKKIRLSEYFQRKIIHRFTETELNLDISPSPTEKTERGGWNIEWHTGTRCRL